MISTRKLRTFLQKFWTSRSVYGTIHYRSTEHNLYFYGSLIITSSSTYIAQVVGNKTYLSPKYLDLPSRLRLAALTIASISNRVISPWLIAKQKNTPSVEIETHKRWFMKIFADAQQRNTIQQGRIGLVSNLLWSSGFEHQSPVKLGKGLDTAQTNHVFIWFRFGGDTDWRCRASRTRRWWIVGGHGLFDAVVDGKRTTSNPGIDWRHRECITPISSMYTARRINLAQSMLWGEDTRCKLARSFRFVRLMLTSRSTDGYWW